MQASILAPTVLLGGIGILLFLGGAWVARGIVRGSRGSLRDPIGPGRVLRGVGLLLIVAAIVFRPENPVTSAIRSPQTDSRAAP